MIQGEPDVRRSGSATFTLAGPSGGRKRASAVCRISLSGFRRSKDVSRRTHSDGIARTPRARSRRCNIKNGASNRTSYRRPLHAAPYIFTCRSFYLDRTAQGREAKEVFEAVEAWRATDSADDRAPEAGSETCRIKHRVSPPRRARVRLGVHRRRGFFLKRRLNCRHRPVYIKMEYQQMVLPVASGRRSRSRRK